MPTISGWISRRDLSRRGDRPGGRELQTIAVERQHRHRRPARRRHRDRVRAPKPAGLAGLRVQAEDLPDFQRRHPVLSGTLALSSAGPGCRTTPQPAGRRPRPRSASCRVAAGAPLALGAGVLLEPLAAARRRRGTGVPPGLQARPPQRPRLGPGGSAEGGRRWVAQLVHPPWPAARPRWRRRRCRPMATCSVSPSTCMRGWARDRR